MIFIFKLLLAIISLPIVLLLKIVQLFLPSTGSANSSSVKGEKIFSADYDNMTGLEFEQFCGKLLMANGFQNVQVTSGSGDFGADIIAYSAGKKYAIQCKKYNSPVGNHAVQEVYAAKAHYGADIAAVLTNSTFTVHAIEQAKSTGVLLWDRKQLDFFLSQCKNYEYNKNAEGIGNENR